MRVIITVLVLALIFSSCGKDKYTTAPQIKYKSVIPDSVSNVVNTQTPVITFSITDAEGDLGITSKDTAFIHIKNLFTNDTALVKFPDIKDITKKDFKADISVSLTGLGMFNCPVSNTVDTIFYEIYVTDFGKNKSNTIVTEDPVFNHCP